MPEAGLHGKPSDVVLKRIISRNCRDETAIEQDISKWWDGELELEPWENVKKPTQRGPKTPSATDAPQTRPTTPKTSETAIAATFKTLLDRVLRSKSPDKDDLAAIVDIQKFLDAPATRRALLYRKNGWQIGRADPFNRNLCWLVAAVQSALGRTISLQEALAFLDKGIRPLAKHLLENYDAGNLYNLFFARRDDGHVESQLPEFAEGGRDGGPMGLVAELKKVFKHGETGGNVHLMLVATLLQAEIHVHKPDVGDGDSHADMASMLRDELVTVHTAIGMPRGQLKRASHIDYQRQATHFDTIFGASAPYLSEAADRDPAKLLETAIACITSLAEANSIEALHERFGDAYAAFDRRPIRRGTGAVDLTDDTPARPSGNRSTIAALTESVQATNANVAALAEQMKQVMLLLSGGLGGSSSGGSGSGGSGPGGSGSGGPGGSGSGGSGSSGSGSGGSGPSGSGSSGSDSPGSGSGGSGSGSLGSGSSGAGSSGSGSGGSGPGSSGSSSSGSGSSGSDSGGASSGGTDADDRGGGSMDYEASLKAALEAMENALNGVDNLCADYVFELDDECSPTGKEADAMKPAIAKALETWRPKLDAIVRTAPQGGRRTKSALALFYRLLCHVTGMVGSEPAASARTASIPPTDQAVLLDQYAPLFSSLFPPGKFALNEITLLSHPVGKSPCFDATSARNVLSLLPSKRC